MSIFPGIVHLTTSDEYFKCLRKLRPFVKIETWLSHLSSFTSCQGISGGKAVHPLIEMANLWSACGELCVKHQHTAYRSVWIHSVWTRRKDLWVVSLNWVWVGEQKHRADGRPLLPRIAIDPGSNLTSVAVCEELECFSCDCLGLVRYMPVGSLIACSELSVVWGWAVESGEELMGTQFRTVVQQ